MKLSPRQLELAIVIVIMDCCAATHDLLGLKNYIFNFRMEKLTYQIIILASFMPRSRLLNEGLLRLVCSANVQTRKISYNISIIQSKT